MPGFVKTPKDEARWSRAKEAAKKSKKKDESAFGDQDWALVNHIYHQMHKAEELGKGIREFFSQAKEDASSFDELKTFLEKARKRMVDEQDEFGDEEPSLEEQGFREFDPEAEGDEADKWLDANDPERNSEEEDEHGEPEEEPESEDDYYDEYGPDEDEDAHQQLEDEDEEPLDEPEVDEEAAGSEGTPAEELQAPAQAQEPVQEVRSEGRFPQPSKEDIAEMRQYTRPWEQRARDKTRLEAEAHKNPVLHHEGRLVEARNAAHKSRQEAYAAHQASPEYQNADPITQMEMDSKFNEDWHKNNPDYLTNAAKIHGEAHTKGLGAKDVHAAAKDEQIRHVLSGGAQADNPMSTEEAMQHAGGTKDEEGTTGSMVQDPSSSFAAGNKEFLAQYAKDYEKKGKKPKSLEDMSNYDEGSRQDVQRVLGEHAALKDPAKKAKVDAFFQKYHPLIGMNAQKVLNKLGIDSKRGDIDLGMLHEAGMHGLMQAINDYDHDHPSKASFATHAGNKIRGLQQTALRDKDLIPKEMRAGAKKFNLQSMIGKHPPEIGDRLKRIQTARQVHPPKPPKPEGGGQQ